MKTIYNLYKVILFTIIAVCLILSVTGIWYGLVTDMIIAVAFGLFGCVYIADNLNKKATNQRVNKAEYVYGVFFILYALVQIVPVLFPAT